MFNFKGNKEIQAIFANGDIFTDVVRLVNLLMQCADNKVLPHEALRAIERLEAHKERFTAFIDLVASSDTEEVDARAQVVNDGHKMLAEIDREIARLQFKLSN